MNSFAGIGNGNYFAEYLQFKEVFTDRCRENIRAKYFEVFM
ncbi:MAG: hypothetical protein ACK5NT_10630 [Pyrinomonadaceae bacterium]